MTTTAEMLANMPREWLEREFRSRCLVMQRHRRLVGVAVCRVLGQYPIEILANDIGCSTHLALDGFWEMWVTMAIAKHVRKGSRCIDVGANVGYFTVLLGAVMECEVFSFEPQQHLVELLRLTCSMNGITDHIVPHAAGSADGGAKLFLDRTTANGTIRSEQSAGDVKELNIGVGRADVIGGAFDFIKIDAEGYEESVMDGMTGIIAASPKLQICMEWTPSKYNNAAHFMDWMLREFQMFLIEGNGDLRPATTADEHRLLKLPVDAFEMVWFRRKE
jgi:FkbM family methyltransferase